MKRQQRAMTNGNNHRARLKVTPTNSRCAALRFLLALAGVFLLAGQVVAEPPSLRTTFVLATHRLENPKANGTAFVVSLPESAGEKNRKLLLVTAAHTFENMSGNKATAIFRRKEPDGTWVAKPIKLDIRQNGKPVWRKHAKQDVAVMRLQNLQGITVTSIPMEVLASDKDWKTNPLEPGSFVRVVGFPHAAQFKPSPAGFPNTRIGCVSSFPLAPYKKHPTFLVDYNSFEGDSGGLVYSDECGDTEKIIGLIHAQHFIDAKYSTTYQQGLIRKRLGLGVVVRSQAILETIAELP